MTFSSYDYEMHSLYTQSKCVCNTDLILRDSAIDIIMHDFNFFHLVAL